MSSRMKCTNCYYGNPVYNAEGVQTGVECGADNMRQITLDVAAVVYCGRWSEAED